MFNAEATHITRRTAQAQQAPRRTRGPVYCHSPLAPPDRRSANRRYARVDG